MSEAQKPTTDAYRRNWKDVFEAKFCVECGKYPAEPPYLICKECLKIQPKFVKEILEADAAPSEARFDNNDDLLKYLNED